MTGELITKQYKYALSVGLILSLLAELIYWICWGLIWLPGHTWEKLTWALSCGIGMGAVVGAISCLLIVGRLTQWKAVTVSFAVVFTVGNLCTVNCFFMDRQSNFWGAATHPQAFLMGGFVGTIICGILYSWLVFTSAGNQLLERGFWWRQSSSVGAEQ